MKRYKPTMVIGLQWGDEGKGKIVDALAGEADLVCRYHGGANAGHTLIVDGEQYILHALPSGVLHPQTLLVIGAGVALDLEQMADEIDMLPNSQEVVESLRISPATSLVLPLHKALDGHREAVAKSEQGGTFLGTTKRGIGPTYEDTVARRGIRFGDLADAKALLERLRRLFAFHREELARAGHQATAEDTHEQLCSHYNRFAHTSCDLNSFMRTQLERGKKILVEGAQGAMLDLDFGTWPYVTSSRVGPGAAASSLGLPPSLMTEVVGVVKAYTTRVGEGPFPSELFGEDADRLGNPQAGNEFGATTGRKRRCGWLDVPALKHVIAQHFVNKLVLTKLDVLNNMGDFCATHAYDAGGKPQQIEFSGWSGDLNSAGSIPSLPAGAKKYVEFLERALEREISMVSYGPDRSALIGEIDWVTC